MNAVRHWWRIVIVVGLIAASTDGALKAQVVSGNLVGTITDPHGGAVANAGIEAIQTGTGIKSAIHSNSSGDYRFTDLPAGDYSLNVTADGFKPAEVKSVALDVSRTATVNVTIQVGPISSSVNVIEAAASIDTTTANLGTSFDLHELDIPVTSIGPGSLGVLNLSLLAAGVASNGGLQLGTGPSVGGMRPRSNNFAVDGADNNNRANTGALAAVPNDATAELTMLQNSFDAQFGHGSGGQFNVIVRTGTNDLHGSLYEYLQNRDLNALDQLFASTGTLSKPRFDSNRFGGNAGGPLRRNKLFYFADLEYAPTGQASSPGEILTPTAAGYTTLAGLPGLSATNLSVLKQYAAPAPVALADKTQYPVVAGTPIPVGILPVVAPSYNNVYNAVASGDYFASPTDQLHLRYILNHSSQIDNAASLPVFFQPTTIGDDLAAITENHIFSPSLIGEFRIAYTRFVDNTPAGNYKFPGLDAFPNIQIAELGLQLGPDTTSPQFVASNTYQAAANFTWTRGRHTVKAGFEAQQAIAPTRFSDNVRGDYEYGSLNVFLQDITPDQVAQRTIGNPTYYGNQHTLAGYVNDSIRVTNRLTANLGIRYEHFSVPYGETRQSLNSIASVPGVLVFNAPKAQYLNFAPRVGLAWSPGSDGKTSVRTGFGMTYDPLYDNIGINSQPPEFAVTVNETSMAIRGFLANGGIVPAAGSGPLTAAQARASTSSYIPDQELPYALQWNIGVQHVFRKDFSIETRYLGTKGVHLDMQTRPTTVSPVTPTHSLPTYLQAPSQAALNALPLTLDQLDNAPEILPQFAAAGFTNGGLVEYAPRGNSVYHGLATEVTKRYSARLQFRAAWTWSHLIDDSTADFFTTLLTPRRPQDSQNLTAERASSALDHRHRVTFAAVYELPPASGSGGFVKQLTSGWSVAPMYIFESPEYVTALSQTDSNDNGDFFSDRVIINPSGASGKGSDVTPLTNSAGATVAYLANNPNARYIVAGEGAYANGGRNTLPGRPINNVDVNILKTMRIGERMRVQFSAQLFNALNHPQFVPGFTNRADNPPNPNNSGNVFNYLTPGSAIFNNPEAIYSSNPRGIQIALKVLF